MKTHEIYYEMDRKKAYSVFAAIRKTKSRFGGIGGYLTVTISLNFNGGARWTKLKAIIAS